MNVGKCAAKDGEKVENSFISLAKECMFRLIQVKIFTKPKDEVAILLMGTDESANKLNQTLGGYEHISKGTGLIYPTWDILRVLKNSIRLGEYDADWLDALIVAMDFIKDESR